MNKEQTEEVDGHSSHSHPEASVDIGDGGWVVCHPRVLYEFVTYLLTCFGPAPSVSFGVERKTTEPKTDRLLSKGLNVYSSSSPLSCYSLLFRGPGWPTRTEDPGVSPSSKSRMTSWRSSRPRTLDPRMRLTVTTPHS